MSTLTHPAEIHALMDREALRRERMARGEPCCEHDPWVDHFLPEDDRQPGFRDLPRWMRYGGCAECECPVIHVRWGPIHGGGRAA